jgi:hypothetical protein
MPNWCKNRVLVVADEAKRAEVLAFVDGGEDQKFDFSKVVPTPATPEYSAAASSSKYTCGCESEFVDGSWQINGKDVVDKKCPDHDAPCVMDSPNNWYNWNIENWGTKWNASDVYISDGVIDFETAWSPAEPVIASLAKRFPEVTFIHDYVEQGIGFVGRKIHNFPDTEEKRNEFATLVCGGDKNSDEWYGESGEDGVPPQTLLHECDVDTQKDGLLVWWATAKALFPDGGWGG